MILAIPKRRAVVEISISSVMIYLPPDLFRVIQSIIISGEEETLWDIRLIFYFGGDIVSLISFSNSNEVVYVCSTVESWSSLNLLPFLFLKCDAINLYEALKGGGSVI